MPSDVLVRVLICDDEPDVRALYRVTFEIAGAEVAEAGDGDEAIAVAKGFLPHLVVLDLNMPRRDGMSAIRDLQEALPDDSQIFVVSAYLSVERVALAAHLQAAASFDKPDFLPRIPQLVAQARGRAAGGAAAK